MSYNWLSPGSALSWNEPVESSDLLSHDLRSGIISSNFHWAEKRFRKSDAFISLSAASVCCLACQNRFQQWKCFCSRLLLVFGRFQVLWNGPHCIRSTLFHSSSRVLGCVVKFWSAFFDGWWYRIFLHLASFFVLGVDSPKRLLHVVSLQWWWNSSLLSWSGQFATCYGLKAFCLRISSNLKIDRRSWFGL